MTCRPSTLQPIVYSPSDVAALLKMNLSNVYDKLARGIIPGKKIGGEWFISIKKFEEWVNDENNPPYKGEGI